MKQHISCKQNSIKTHSKNVDRKLTLMAIATDLLRKVLRISVTTLSLSPKLGTKTLRWCSYGMTLKKDNQLSMQFLPFLHSTVNVVGRHNGPFLRYGQI